MRLANMILFLLLPAMSLASGSTGVSTLIPPPPYVESYREITNADQIIQDNILSMDGHIPLLNDSRRAYAEITHVIFNIANIIAHSCFRPVYENIYQEIVNNTLPEALGQPQEVVETAKELFTALDDKTLKIQKLIIEITKAESNDVVADALINKIITNDPKEYKLEAEVLLAAGASAKKFNEMKDTFHDVATSLESHKYIIRATQELKALILSLTSAIHLIKTDSIKC